jgi:prolyl-tRNA editing enzyme YbaK/EbsC (Cys-tRNA(Pro) deacylase)
MSAFDHRNVRAVVDGGTELGVDVTPVPFDGSTRTAEEAAAAIGVDVGAIVKSMVFTVDGQAVLALVSGRNRVDETKLGRAAGGGRARRADADGVRAATGFPIGGVPPFGFPAPLPTYVDADLLRYDEVWAACGMPHVNFAAAPDDLVRATEAVVCTLAVDG